MNDTPKAGYSGLGIVAGSEYTRNIPRSFIVPDESTSDKRPENGDMIEVGESTERERRYLRRLAVCAVAAVLVIHAGQCVRLFPSVGSIASWDPVITVDHAIHEYHGALGSAFLRDQGTSWGIDPYFMAGYPETPVWDSSSNLAIGFMAAAGGGYQPAAYKIGLLIASWLTIALIPGACRLMKWDWLECAFATVLCWLVFWVGRPVMFWRSGLFAFVFASALSLYVSGSFIAYVRGRGFLHWANLAASLALLLFSHVTAIVLLTGSAIGFLAAVARRLTRREWAELALAAAVAIVVNQDWLRSLWRFRELRSVKGVFLALEIRSIGSGLTSMDRAKAWLGLQYWR